MTQATVRREPGLIEIVTEVGGRFADRFYLPLDAARDVMHQLQDMFSAVVCPPDCCGRQMESIMLVIDKKRRDCWRCPVCGELRTRRV